MQSVYVAGVGMTKFGKDPRPLAEIFSQAAQLALTEAELQEVDALYVGAMNPEEFTGDSNIASLIADAIGLTGVPAIRIETASSAAAPERSWLFPTPSTMIGSHGSPSPRAACRRGCAVSCGDPATRPGQATQRARSPSDDARTIARAAGSDRHEHAGADTGTAQTSRSTRSSGGHRAVARINDCRAASAEVTPAGPPPTTTILRAVLMGPFAAFPCLVRARRY